MMGIKSNQNIIVGVTGSIAAYKSPIIVRRLKEQHYDVIVVMSESAKAFISPLTLQAVSGNAVRSELLDAQAESAMDHIDLARWADLILIAPATAHFMAKLAHGMADDLLSTLCLATNAPIYIAPAMNQQMWKNKLTQKNVKKLNKFDINMLGPDQGDQACGETGLGRMLEPEKIVESLSIMQSNVVRLAGKGSPLYDKKILITAGPTVEAIDPVRVLTNHSSGKMGYALAQVCVNMGIDTTLISGPTSLTFPDNCKIISIKSAQQMYDTVHQHIADKDIFISVAAVSDYRPEKIEDQKIKKSKDTIELTLIRNPDILSSVAGLKPAPFTVGFAAETSNLHDYALKKLKNKKIDMIIANLVGDGIAFAQDDNQVEIITEEKTLKLGPDNKLHLANELMLLIGDEFEKKHPAKSS